jgi:hypothetical protein
MLGIKTRIVTILSRCRKEHEVPKHRRKCDSRDPLSHGPRLSSHHYPQSVLSEIE